MNRILILIILISHALYGKAQTVFELTDHQKYQPMGLYFGYFEDPENNLSFNDALKGPFKPCDNIVPNLGFTKGAIWMKAQIMNKASNEPRFQVNQAIIDVVTLFLLKDNQLVDSFQMGEAFPFKQRLINDPYFIFPLNLEANQEYTLLLKIQSREQIVLPLYVTTEDVSLNKIDKRNLLFGVYFGIILVMALYNLFIFFSTRDKSYLIYVFYILLVGSTQGVLEGYGFQYLFPNNPWLASRSVYLFSFGVSAASIVFLQIFLHTAKHTPKLHRFGMGVFALLGLGSILSIWEVNQLTHMIAQSAVGLVSFYILWSSYFVYRTGYRPARFFLFAWLVLVLGIMLFVLKDAGIIPVNLWTNYTMQIGSAVEVVLLSFALADRINILKKEKEESQQEAFNALKENERLIREQNVILEQKVTERTEALNASNKELAQTLSDLKSTQSQLVQAEKMASLGQLTAGIAHEINNPINFVSANISPLRMDIDDVISVINKYDEVFHEDKYPDERQKVEALKKQIDYQYVLNEISELLDGIEDGAQRTSEIVKGLKTFSRLDELDLKPTDLNEGLLSTLVILRNATPDNVRVETDLAEIPHVECFPGKINQVFMNLISNALQAMKGVNREGKNRLFIQSRADDTHVHFIIEDTGMGMTEDVKEKIFEPFFTTKGVGEGTGLGLSIVYQIIQTHSGIIKVESIPGEGTKFFISLPIVANVNLE